MPARIVLVSLGEAPGEGLAAGVSALRRAGATVHLVSRADPAAALVEGLDGVLPFPGGRLPAGEVRMPAALRSGRLGRSPLGRVADKVWFRPDRLPGAVRSLRRAPVRDLVRSAGAVVALDEAAVPAVWLAARRHRHLVALHGLPAAVNRWGA